MSNRTETVSDQAEEYIEAIYRLEQKWGAAKTMDIARALNVVPGSVTNTIELLKRKGLVTHRPYRGVKLTDNGKKIAASIIRRHRLAERLLTDILHIDWSEVHDLACKLEHALPPEILKPLEKALGHPKSCPHGNPIPTKCGSLIEEETVALSELEENSLGVIVKITEEKAETLQQLSQLKLTVGKKVKVKQADPDGAITVFVEEKSALLDTETASIIYVKRVNEKVRC